MGKRIVINDRTRKIRAGLLLLLILIGIGYAAIRSGLNINGTTHVMSNTWDVHFENYQASSGSVTPTTEPSTTGNPTSISYEVTLTNPGDYYEFTIDAVNNGTMDTMIESFSSKIGNTEITPSTLPPYLSYSATYSDGTAIANKQELLHNTREKLKLRIAYRDDIPTTDLPSTVQDLSLSFTITYVQKDDSSIPVPHPITKYTVNIYDSAAEGYNQVYIGQAIPNTITPYDTPAAAMAAFSNRPFYLKHTISNNIVTESYLGFVVTDAMAQDNPGVTAGTYYLRGGINESSLAEQPVYEANKAVLLSAFGSSYCSGGSSHFDCHVSGLSATAYSDGGVQASGGGSAYCFVFGGGSSHCSG